jgi:hypothetical protein
LNCLHIVILVIHDVPNGLIFFILHLVHPKAATFISRYVCFMLKLQAK